MTLVMRDEKMEPVDKRDFDHQSWEKAARLLDAAKHVPELKVRVTGRFLKFHFGADDAGCEKCRTELVLTLDFMTGIFSVVETSRGKKNVKYAGGRPPSELGVPEPRGNRQGAC